jgi:hypothetical protein
MFVGKASLQFSTPVKILKGLDVADVNPEAEAVSEYVPVASIVKAVAFGGEPNVATPDDAETDPPVRFGVVVVGATGFTLS